MIRVFFDNTEINGNNILNLTQSVQPYGESFVLGSTICRQFSIDVNDLGYSSVPNFVYLYEDNASDTQSEWKKYATLLVDNVERQDQHYTTFSLTDVMVRFNVDLKYTVGQTVLQILQNICASKNISLVNTSFYMSDLQITWQDELYERDLISYVAEVNGGYAYIDADGNLNIAEYENKSAGFVDINMCSSYKIGELHRIERVYVELGTATQYYPATAQHDTVYLDPGNILLTDTQGYTIENTIKHIYSVINGFTFYNIDIGQCPIDPGIRAGQLLGVGGWGHLQTSDGDYITTSDGNRILITDGLMIPFICTIDWNYNTKWLGGYKLDVDCKIQEETRIISSKEQIRRISITVDRELGVIDQRVTDLSSDVGEVEASLTLKIDKTDNDQIISMINASADNIILNTKSLIFGVYPSGKYIEVKNFYENNVATGVAFEGNGYVTFKPLGAFQIINGKVEETALVANNFSVSNTNSISRIFMRNYDLNYNYDANSIGLFAEQYSNYTQFRNCHIGSGNLANGLSFQSDSPDGTDTNTIVLENYLHNGTARANRIAMYSKPSTALNGNELYITNYNTESDISANAITLKYDGASSGITITNNLHDSGGGSANSIALTHRDDVGQPSLNIINNKYSDGSTSHANVLKFSGDQTAILWSSNDLRLRSGGAVRIYANLGEYANTGDYNDNPNGATQDTYVGGYSLKLQAQAGGKIYLYWGSARYYIGRATVNGTNVLTWTSA